MTGPGAGAELGWSVAVVGDTDGDGTPDLLIGAPEASPSGIRTGGAYLYSGRDGSLLHVLFAANVGSRFGQTVADGGDMDGDGLHDVVVGAPSFGNGAVFAYSGASGAWLWSRSGGVFHEIYASAIGGGHDVDGDGLADAIVGDEEYPNGAGDTGVFHVLSGADGVILHRVEAPTWGYHLGSAVTILPDWNGDGLAELAVGADSAPGGGRRRGTVTVYSGSNLAILYEFSGDRDLDHLGESVARAGDVDGDGIVDLIAGAPLENSNGLNSGMARVYSGADGSVLHTFLGSGSAMRFGTSLAGAGDVDEDGFADLLIGAPTAIGPAPGVGLAFLHSGRDGSLLYLLGGSSLGDQFGRSVAGTGDWPQVPGRWLVGAPGVDLPLADSGRASVYAPAGLEVTPLIAGTTGDFVGSALDALRPSWLAASLDGPGFTEVPPAEVRLGLAGAELLAGPKQADASGGVVWKLPVPQAAQGLELWFQAFQSGLSTNLVSRTVQ